MINTHIYILSVVILVITYTGVLAGCSSAPHQKYDPDILQITELPLSVAKVEGYDLKVMIRSAYDFGLNSNILEDRLRMIKERRPDCKNPTVVGERVTEGRTAIGVTMNRYYMNVKC